MRSTTALLSGKAVFCQNFLLLIVLLTVLPWAESALGGDTVDAIFNKPDLKVPLSQISSAQYLERLAQTHYEESGDEGATAAAVYEMLVAQQRWRRGAAPRDKYIGNPYDCQPTYKLSKDTTKWFHTRRYEVGLCFTVCADYPHCTHTTPLVGTEDTGLSLLMHCGVRAMDQTTDVKQEVILVTKDAHNNMQPVCRSVVDRAVDLPGVTVKAADTNLDNRGLQLKAFTRAAQAHRGELAIFTPDLWSHWKNPLLSVSDANVTGAGAVQAIVRPDGDPKAKINYDNFFNDGANITELSLGATQMALDAIWLIAPWGKDYMTANYVVSRPDLDHQWLTFITYNTLGDTYSDVNGPCTSTIQSLWDTAAVWNSSSVVNPANYSGPCHYLSTSNVSTVEQVGGDWANGGTAFYRPDDRQHNRCPIVLDAPLDSFVEGCNRKSLFVVNTYGNPQDGKTFYCQASQLVATPAVEARLWSGVMPYTYMRAWQYYTVMQALPSAQSDILYIDSNTTAFRGDVSTSLTDYYMLMNASWAWNTSDLQRFQLRSFLAAQQRLTDENMDSFDDGATIVAFTTLLITMLTIPTHWSADLQERLLGYVDNWCPHVNKRMWARILYIGVARFLASAVVVGPAIFSFVTVVAQGTGTSIRDGFPTINFVQSTLTGQPCQLARTSGNVALGTTETALLVTTVQTWAVVLVCVVSVLLILAAAAFAMWKATKTGASSLPSVVKPVLPPPSKPVAP